jgi:hypothetical protein
MLHKRFTVVTLVFLLLVTISVSACAPIAGNTPDTNVLSVQEVVQVIPIPGWQQVNTNGFGDPKELEVSALESFNGYLYAGTYNVVDPLQLFDGARIFRTIDGVTWSPITQPGFQNPHDSAPPAILNFVVFGNRIYASTGRGGNPAQIWRASNGVSWAPMVTAGFGDPDLHDIAALAVYNNMIYAGASSQASGARIFSSSTGDSNTWNPMTSTAPTMPGAGVTGFAVFNGSLWASIESEAPVQIWRSSGGTWTSVMNNGFGNSLTTSTGGMAVFGGYLYIGAGNTASGAQLWRTTDGASWTQAITPGFGDPNNQTVETVFVFQNQLYVSVKNAVTGMEVWRSADGTLWEQANPDGFGDSNNSTTNGSHATADFLSQLYVGTSNVVDGGELWRMLQQITDTPTATFSPSPTQTSTNTPTNTATDTPTFTPTNTPTDTSTNTPTATPSPTQTPTDTATNTPTDTPTLTDTPTETQTVTITPTDTATETPTNTPTETPIPLSNTPGKVTGGGTIGSVQDSLKASFGFTINYSEGDLAPKGNLTYQDHTANLRLKADSFDLLVIEGNHAFFTGTGVMNDGQVVIFTVEIDALSKLGLADTFSISIPALNGYSVAEPLAGGNITIH